MSFFVYRRQSESMFVEVPRDVFVLATARVCYVQILTSAYIRTPSGFLFQTAVTDLFDAGLRRDGGPFCSACSRQATCADPLWHPVGRLRIRCGPASLSLQRLGVVRCAASRIKRFINFRLTHVQAAKLKTSSTIKRLIRAW